MAEIKRVIMKTSSYYPGAQAPSSSLGKTSKFELKAKTQEEEDAYDTAAARNILYPSGFIATVANLVKGALGSGILGTHTAYMHGGYLVGFIGNTLLGTYVGYCYWMLAMSARKMYKRTNIPRMTYSDVGEAAFACSKNPTLNRLAMPFRYAIDLLICLELFGSCCCYQLIVGKTIKQLVENTETSDLAPLIAGYPSLREYIAMLIVPFIGISLIRHLQWIAPISMFGNAVVLFCIGVTVYYGFANNPEFKNIKPAKDINHFFQYTGMIMFSMSCIGVILPAENNMKNPKRYTPALMTAMFCIISWVITSGFFGYVAFQEDCKTPITMNYPNNILMKMLKAGIAIMVYFTHALNFWVPFELLFHYIELRIKNKNKVIYWDYGMRVLFCLIVSMIAILFPSVNKLMGFLGSFCLANLIFIFPNLIYLLTVWERPGLGRGKWRLILFIFITIIGLCLFLCGSVINGKELIKVMFSK